MTDQYVDEDFDDDYADDHLGEHDDHAQEDEYGYDEDHRDDDEAVRPRPVEKLRSTELEGRTSWYYLGLLTGLSVLLVFFAWACDDRSSEAPLITESASEEPTATVAVRLVIDVDGDIIILRGSVPDDAARAQIVSVAGGHYGPENVIDELTVDASSTFEGGSVSVTGSAPAGDPRPEALRQAISSDFGLAADFSVARGEAAALAPVRVTVEVDGPSVSLRGGVPDQASIDDLTAAAEAVWGAGNVDTSGLVVSESTWTDGVVTATGTASIGDTRAAAFPAEVQSRFGALVTVDVGGVQANDDPAALTDIEEEINGQLAIQPIRFAPESADIETESDEVLADIAAKLNEIPAVSVEVVGHTDSLGPDDENLVLSQQRAEAVINRLVELGVAAERLNARGEGEAFPIADNSTDAGREQNRRIEFRLVAG